MNQRDFFKKGIVEKLNEQIFQSIINDIVLKKVYSEKVDGSNYTRTLQGPTICGHCKTTTKPTIG